jgi:hypothetical protein
MQSGAYMSGVVICCSANLCYERRAYFLIAKSVFSLLNIGTIDAFVWRPCLMHVKLSNEGDAFVWRLTNSRNFTVGSLYLDHINDQIRYLRKYI